MNQLAKQTTSSAVSEIVRGLRGTPKQLSPALFYDQRGSRLFDQICELPEYYVTRVETAILREHAPAIARAIGDDALLVELGSGSSTKTRLVLDALASIAAYVPVDISREHLFASAAALANDYPSIDVLPLCADFLQPFTLPRAKQNPARVVFFFPGSTIGNLDATHAKKLLTRLRSLAGRGGGLVIGVDLVKDANVLRAAYNDAAAVTAEFNRNVLVHLNRDYGADFDVESFEHEAVWDAAQRRIEMRLVSQRAQTVMISGASIDFAAGEHIVTE
ncbi:MAG: L-histidine N(alpha)-methyltransferase, partial [Steroidobacteraceae bacterium]